MNDGTQIWKITHNGVDTHPIHFHFGDVQLINRVGWDGIIRPPDPDELGWKDTVRVSPLEDTIVAMRPLLPQAPFGIEQSKRPLNPSLPIDSPIGFVSIEPDGTAITPAYTNVMTNFDWEYVWHCHILSHEEMDMMHPLTVSQKVEVPAPSVLTTSVDPANGAAVLNWTDPTGAPLGGANVDTWGNPQNEVGYEVFRQALDRGRAQPWRDRSGRMNRGVELVGNALANQVTLTDPKGADKSYAYLVVSWNAKGTTDSNTVIWNPGAKAPDALTTLTAAPASSVDRPGVEGARK